MPASYQLCLIRHGVAEERGEAWPDDTKRPLSADGASRMRKAARGLAHLGVDFDVILSSPLVRTRQTADLVASAFDSPPPVVLVDSLAPGGSIAAVMSDLRAHSQHARIAMVGHEPGIGELAARFASFRHPLKFKKGAICRIDVDTLPPGGGGTLRWFLTTKILRAIRD